MRTSFWRRLLDVISPRSCIVCGRRLSVNEQALCAACHLHLPFTHYEQQPFDNPMARLFWGQFPVERVAALFFYEPSSKLSHIIYDMKYHGRSDACVAMGEIAARHFDRTGFFQGIDAIIPMPITKRRQWQRGYNQSMELARGVAVVTSLPIWGKVVRRTHFKQSQTTQHAYERQLNVEDAFLLVDANKIAGRHLLLIDDIVTTGATITACARQLCKAPGVSVSILAIGMTKS